MADGATRPGDLSASLKRYTRPQSQRMEERIQVAEIRRLKAELKRVTEERDILLSTAKND